MTDKDNSLTDPLKSLIPSELLEEFRDWARDGGYDESYFNRWDSKSRHLEETFLQERREVSASMDAILP